MWSPSSFFGSNHSVLKDTRKVSKNPNDENGDHRRKQARVGHFRTYMFLPEWCICPTWWTLRTYRCQAALFVSPIVNSVPRWPGSSVEDIFFPTVVWLYLEGLISGGNVCRTALWWHDGFRWPRCLNDSQQVFHPSPDKVEAYVTMQLIVFSLKVI